MADESNATPEAAGEQPKPAAGETAAAGAADEQAAPTGTTGDATASPEAASETSTADPWAPFDAVLGPFAVERRLGVGTACGEQWTETEGRFLCWDNRSGWRCSLRLLRPPEEEVVVLLAEGPPLPGGRARTMLLGGFPSEFDAQMLRAALELGFAVGETWGPAEEPARESASATSAADEPTNSGSETQAG
jgi:hypothetical protein